MFGCMKQLVQQREHTQQQHHDSPHHQHQLQASQQMADCCATDGRCFAPAAAPSQCPAGLNPPAALSFKLPCTQEQAAAATAAACVPGACCPHCSFGKPEAAAEQALLRTTWQQHFLPLLLDMHAALTCAPKPFSCKPHNAAPAEHHAAPSDSSTHSFAAAARIPNALEGWAQHNTAAAQHPFSNAAASGAAAAAAVGGQVARPAILLELAGCAPLPVDVAGQMLISFVEFLALHNCWCNVSYLLAEAFKNGLLAMTGVLAAQQLQRLHELQRLQAPVCSAALTAASLVASLAEGAAAAADEEDAADAAATTALAAALRAKAATPNSSAGSVTAHSSSSKSSRSNSATYATSAPGAAVPSTTTCTVSAPPASATPRTASTHSHHHPSAVSNTTVAAVLLLLFMPAAALLVASAAGPGYVTGQSMELSFGCSSNVVCMLPIGVAAAAPAVRAWVFTALLSVVLLVLVVVAGSRKRLRWQV
jgi:hypothetical protein